LFKVKAGKYGSLNAKCDNPPILLEETLNFIRDQIKPDAIFWTGDSVPNDVQIETEEEVAESTLAVTRLI
jgi:hypothetical protein